MMKTWGLAPIVLLAACCGCGGGLMDKAPAVGSGTVKEEERRSNNFKSMEVTGSLQATVLIGPDTSLRVSADDNLLPFIKTEVRDGRLEASLTRADLRPKNPILLTITTSKLDSVRVDGAAKVEVTAGYLDLEVEAAGAGQVTVKELEADNLVIRAEGASKVAAGGKVKKLTLSVADSAEVKAAEMQARVAQVQAGGASRAEVQASDSFQGTLSEAARVVVSGAPRSRAVRTSGNAASVSYVDDKTPR